MRVGGARVGGVEHICVEMALSCTPPGACHAAPTPSQSHVHAPSERALIVPRNGFTRARSRVRQWGGFVIASPPITTRAWRGSAFTGPASTVPDASLGQVSARGAAACPLCPTGPTPRAHEHIRRVPSGVTNGGVTASPLMATRAWRGSALTGPAGTLPDASLGQLSSVHR